MQEMINQLSLEAREFATSRHPISNIQLAFDNDKFEQKFLELALNEIVEGIFGEPHEVSETFTPLEIQRMIKFHFGIIE